MKTGTNVRMDEPSHSHEQRQAILARMKEVSDTFYSGATRAGAHSFIEFCGLMNEFLAICHAAEKEGIDWVMANTHSGKALPMQTHHAAYLAEKLNCIYGPALLRDGRVRDAFIHVLFEGECTLVQARTAGKLFGDNEALRAQLTKKTRLTTPQRRMLTQADAILFGTPVPYSVKSTNEKVTARVLHRLGLGVFDETYGTLAITSAGRAWRAKHEPDAPAGAILSAPRRNDATLDDADLVTVTCPDRADTMCVLHAGGWSKLRPGTSIEVKGFQRVVRASDEALLIGYSESGGLDVRNGSVVDGSTHKLQPFTIAG